MIKQRKFREAQSLGISQISPNQQVGDTSDGIQGAQQFEIIQISFAYLTISEI